MYNRERTEILDRREMLRVKVMSLMAEAMIIRAEERKQLYCRRDGARRGGNQFLYEELHLHLVKNVRAAARLAHLAYGAVRGMPLEQMEAPGSTKLLESEKKEILQMFKRYGVRGAPAPEWMLPTVYAPVAVTA
jgi:hypothetical protein